MDTRLEAIVTRASYQPIAFGSKRRDLACEESKSPGTQSLRRNNFSALIEQLHGIRAGDFGRHDCEIRSQPLGR
ncbi:MAG TPA: hypothetical protein VNM37_16625, partial [Candidatus Dormibacteraeota bacterium]|nr:hypothetical protein [Candidatus Dormibacteraeota bacterium]